MMLGCGQGGLGRWQHGVEDMFQNVAAFCGLWRIRGARMQAGMWLDLAASWLRAHPHHDPVAPGEDHDVHPQRRGLVVDYWQAAGRLDTGKVDLSTRRSVAPRCCIQVILDDATQGCSCNPWHPLHSGGSLPRYCSLETESA